MTTRSSKRQIKLEDGSRWYTKYNYYACNNCSNGKECSCKIKSHKNNTIEEPVLNEIYNYLDLLERRDLKEYAKELYKNSEDIEGKQIKELEKNIKKYVHENELYKEKIIKGESTFTRELLTGVIEENNKKIEESKKQKNELESLKKRKEIDFEEMLKVKSLIPDWKKVLKSSSKERQKMILSSIIKEIIVYDDKIDIHLKIGFEEFVRTAEKVEVSNIKNYFENISNTRTAKFNTYLGTFW